MKDSTDRKTILVSAYACEPLKGSEQGVGWNWVLQMAKNNILHVITRTNNKEIIEANIPPDIASNLIFHYYDPPRCIRKLKNRAKGLYFYYFCWQIGIIKLINQLQKDNTFDYSMHLTFGNIWMPTFLPFLKIPFIWGPLGGADAVPKSFIKTFSFKQRFIQRARYVLNFTATLNPLIIYSSRRAVSILCRTSQNVDIIPKRYRAKTKIILETSIESDIFNYSRNNTEDTKIVKLVIVGRLVAFKNVVTAIKSLTYLPDHCSYSLTIIGSGSERKRIQKEIEINNLTDKVKLIKEMSRSDVLKVLTESDIFVFPSLREGGSWALMEAMAIGLPTICLDWSGMQIITDNKSAIRLPVSDPEQMPKDMGNAILKLINNPKLRVDMGLAARERIKDVFNWETKGEFMKSLLVKLDKGK